MKKLLLTLSSVLIVAIAFSQQQNLTIKNEAQACKLKYLPPQDGTPYANPLMVTHVLPAHQSNGGLRTLTEVKFSSSHNGFMLLVSESQCITVNSDLKLINFTQRAPESIVLANGGNTDATGIITNSFTTNDGASWDTTNIIMTVQGAAHCRYPSGGIFNPPGNTNPQLAYAVVAGPCTDDADWIQYYYGSMRLDETNNDQQFYDNQNGSVFQQMPRLSFTTCGDMAFVLGSVIDYNAAPLFTNYPGAVINRGVFNTGTNKFDWTQTMVHIPFALDQAGDQQFANLGNLAFNDDGSVGYFVILGIDSLNPVGYYPVVFKSLDYGVTWAQQSFFDFRNIPIWSDYLIATTGGQIPKPFFSSTDGIDAVVDQNNNLHIISTIYSSYSDNPDSLGFTWTGGGLRALIFDVHQFGDVWDAYFLDSLIAVNGVSGLWTTTQPGGIGVDARIQAAFSPDRTKICAIWADTDPLLSNINDYPDLKGIGVDWTTAIPQSAGPVNFTAYTDYTYLNSWHYVSDRAVDAGGGLFTIPVTISLSRDQSNSMDAVMDHYYVNDISFPFTVGVPSVNDVSFTVDQNYPNPFSDQTQIRVTLEKATDVNLKITNILGQEVANKNFSFSGGSHSIHLSKGNFTSGVYNFTVTADGKQISKTMIIQ